MPSRRDDVAAYFAANATRLERTVARHVNASAPTVEDACATAWCVLVRRADIRLDAQGFWWLYRVAVHEAWKLTGEERRAPSVDVDELAECLSSSVEVTEHAEQRQTLRLLRELPERQARILVLRAYGFTYAEIARMTGATLRTIDRQLRRARQRLRDAECQTLAEREATVLDHVAAGLTIRAIARELDLADETIREYLADAYRKLGVRTRTEAVTAHRARRAG